MFRGDFRQVLPVVRRGSRAQIVDASLQWSYLWDFMRHLKLVRNMRAYGDHWFADYLLRIDGGTEEVNVMGRSVFQTKFVFRTLGVAVTLMYTHRIHFSKSK